MKPQGKHRDDHGSRKCPAGHSTEMFLNKKRKKTLFYKKKNLFLSIVSITQR